MNVLLVPDTANAAALGAAVELATWCSGGGLTPILEDSDAAACGLDSLGVAPRDIGEPTLAVALGGDGTILKAFHLLGDVSVPLLGVKFGRLGFLSGATPERMREAVEAVLAGEATLEPRTTLRAEIIAEDRVLGSYRALNEVVLGRGASPHMVGFDVAITGFQVASMRADGIIVSTATGSTAYALSAGGPVVAPGFRGMVVVPVAPHTVTTRAIVTDGHDDVEIRVGDRNRSETSLAVDGFVMPVRRPIDSLRVHRGEHDVLIAKLDGRNFYETVSQEFFGGR